jgi:hypothetical protein
MEQVPTQPQPIKPANLDWVQQTNGGWEREVLETETPLAPVEQHAEQEQTQYDVNRNLLANSEMGILLTGLYDAAVAKDPRLGEISIVPYSDSERGTRGSAFARAADKSQSGKHEIHVRLGDTDETADLMQDTLDRVPGLREIVAQKLAIEPAELKPLQLHGFIMLHEMGHLVEFMDHEGRMPKLRERMKHEKDALPLGGIATSALIDEDSPGGQYVRANWEEISNQYSVESIAELADLKNAAHRSMTSEAFADNFASDVLAYEPTLLDQLGSDTVDTYRTIAA